MDVETEIEAMIGECMMAACTGDRSVAPLPAPAPGADSAETFLHWLGQVNKNAERAEVLRAMAVELPRMMAEWAAERMELVEALAFGYEQRAKQARRRAGGKR